MPKARTPKPNAAPASGAPARPNNRATALALLRRSKGATIAELTAATGWLAHSTRAVLSGLRKEGTAITRFKRDGATCYRIEEQG